MKPLISIFALIMVTAFSASAAPDLLLDCKISNDKVKDEKRLLVIESGKTKSIPIGKRHYSFTPKLLRKNTVEIKVVITEGEGEKKRIVSQFKIISDLGNRAKIRSGDFVLDIVASRAPAPVAGITNLKPSR